MEDVYGLRVCSDVGGVCLRVTSDGQDSEELLEIMTAWQEQRAKLESGEISREEYDRWRYYYPKLDSNQPWARFPSKELNQAMVEAFKGRIDM